MKKGSFWKTGNGDENPPYEKKLDMWRVHCACFRLVRGGGGLVFLRKTPDDPPPGSPWHPRGAGRPGGAGCLFLAHPRPRLGAPLRAGGLLAAWGGPWLDRAAACRPTAKDREEIFRPCSKARPLRSSGKRPGLFLQLLGIGVQFLFLLLLWSFTIHGHIQAVPAIVDQGAG